MAMYGDVRVVAYSYIACIFHIGTAILIGVRCYQMQAAYHPGFGATINYTVTELPNDPDEQVADTIAVMGRYAREDSNTPQIREAIRQAIEQYGPDPIWNSYWFTKRLIQFGQDEDTAWGITGISSVIADKNDIAEAIVRPRDLWDMGLNGSVRIEDCDGFSMFLAAMLKGQRVDCAFVTIAADKRDPSVYSHVYVAAYPSYGGRVPLDASHGPHPDWEFESPYRRREWAVGSMASGEAIAVGLLIAGTILSKLIKRSLRQ